ncbi:MAG: hypothetical protein JOY92_03665 [Verrucomicrobia bacterium]|nr:hypothetical protein [Verrucomicrobiota bacterium]
MKVGDPVFIVSYRSGLEPGTRARIVALDGSSAWVSVSSPAEPRVFLMQIWDLLPARTYGCVVLHVVCDTIRSLKASGGSTLLLTPEQLVRKLVEHGLSPRVARQCVELWDTQQENANPLPVQDWLRQIKRYYSQGIVLQPSGPTDQSLIGCSGQSLDQVLFFRSSRRAASEEAGSAEGGDVSPR